MGSSETPIWTMTSTRIASATQTIHLRLASSARNDPQALDTYRLPVASSGRVRARTKSSSCAVVQHSNAVQCCS